MLFLSDGLKHTEQVGRGDLPYSKRVGHQYSRFPHDIRPFKRGLRRKRYSWLEEMIIDAFMDLYTRLMKVPSLTELSGPENPSGDPLMQSKLRIYRKYKPEMIED